MVRTAFVAILLSVVTLATAVPAYATSGTLLSFSGFKDMEAVGNFYSGGTNMSGFMGPNFGITFSSNTLAITSYLKGGSGAFVLPPTQTPAIFFNNGTPGSMNVAAGFSGGLNFFYAAGSSATVTVWSGANGTGSILATITLSPNGGSAGGCTGFPTYCNWTNVGLSFSGTALSVTFSGPANQLGIADITVGSHMTAIPEPSTLALLGTGMLGISSSWLRKLARRRK